MTAATTQTLSAFLLARIEEDEEAARAASPGGWHAKPPHAWGDDGRDDCELLVYGEQRAPWGDAVEVTPGGGEHGDYGLSRADAAHIVRHDPTRVLAECEAKRAIVGLHDSDDGTFCNACTTSWPCATIKAMATVHAAHPDFDPSWHA